jgi:cytochrome b6-f complex iron-sulfur subunit
VSTEPREPEPVKPPPSEPPAALPAEPKPVAAKVEAAAAKPSAPAAPATTAAAAPAAPKPAAGKPAAKKEEEKPSRRELLTTSVAIGAGWVCFGGATGVAFGPGLGRFLMPNVVEEPDPKVRVGPISKYLEQKPGEVNEDYKPHKIWMIREEEKIAALSTTCTHLGCIPNWLPNDRKFKCPCHGSGFYPTGINFEGPAPRPLERFKISVDNGIVLVDRSRKFQQEMGQWENPDSFLKA